MDFDGQVWFNFTDDAVWRFYRFVRELASAGARVGLDWRPLPTEAEAGAMSVFESLSSPEDRGRYLHALLGLVHIEDRDPGEPETVAEAVRAAEVQPGARAALDSLTEEAARLGVRTVPALYRHGPVVTVRLTDAALSGDVRRTAATILEMASDDGIWELSKP